MSYKQQQFLDRLQKTMEGGAVQPEELMEAVNTLIKIINEYRDELDSKLTKGSTALNKELSRTIGNLNAIQNRLEKAIVDANRTSSSELKSLLRTEISRLEDLIPTPTDLKPLEDRLETALRDLEARIPKLPDEITPQAIRNKLESLEGDERLDASAIKGLVDEIKSIRSEFKKVLYAGAAPMSVSHFPIHETFTMDGVATTVTLSQAPGAAGTAIFGIRYQGQTLDMTTHYTVSGNIVTLVGFTPENGSIISASYMP